MARRRWPLPPHLHAARLPSSGLRPSGPSRPLLPPPPPPPPPPLAVRAYSPTPSRPDVEITRTSASNGASAAGSGQEGDGDRNDELGGVAYTEQAEKRILEMQQNVRTHHRHAAYHEALNEATLLLEACTKVFGEAHPSTASAHNNVGLMHKMLGDFGEAGHHYGRSLELYGEVVGRDHGSYAAALHNLGGLERARSTMDEGLDLGGRLRHNERAAGYFGEALKVRVAELGDDHPHTVASRSALGGALAAVVLQRHAAAAAAAAEAASSSSSSSSPSSGGGDGEDRLPQGRSPPPAPLDDGRGWEAAEEHLRAAMRTSVTSPRGRQAVNAAGAAVRGGGEGTPAAAPLRGPRSKKELMREKKQRSREKRLRFADGGEEGRGRGRGRGLGAGAGADADGATAPEVRTLSAASAAQNLAVFLKSRADVLGAAAAGGMAVPAHLDRNDMYSEARGLYEASLAVRTELRDAHHPDVVGTKFSLAELLEATGDADGANRLRNEIVETYGITEGGEEGEDEDEEPK